MNGIPKRADPWLPMPIRQPFPDTVCFRSAGLMLWVASPLAGLVTACQAVRRGLNNYLAWIPPAPCLYLANLAVWGYAPPAGPALLTALASLVGAAAGQVLLQRGENKTHARRRRR